MKVKLSKKNLYQIIKQDKNTIIESFHNKKLTFNINENEIILNELQITIPKKNIDTSQNVILNFIYTIIHKNSFGWVTICKN